MLKLLISIPSKLLAPVHPTLVGLSYRKSHVARSGKTSGLGLCLSDFVFFLRQSHYVAQVGLELVILLPLPPEWWDDRHIRRCLASFMSCDI